MVTPIWIIVWVWNLNYNYTFVGKAIPAFFHRAPSIIPIQLTGQQQDNPIFFYTLSQSGLYYYVHLKSAFEGETHDSVVMLKKDGTVSVCLRGTANRGVADQPSTSSTELHSKVTITDPTEVILCSFYGVCCKENTDSDRLRKMFLRSFINRLVNSYPRKLCAAKALLIFSVKLLWDLDLNPILWKDYLSTNVDWTNLRTWGHKLLL